MQVCWLYNPTKNDIDYSFDRAAFERFNEDHGAEVFALMNPSGIVRALSYKPVLIKFQSTRWGTFEVRRAPFQAIEFRAFEFRL